MLFMKTLIVGNVDSVCICHGAFEISIKDVNDNYIQLIIKLKQHKNVNISNFV